MPAGGAIGGGTAVEAARGKEVVQQAGTNPAGPAEADTARIVGTKRLYADGKQVEKDKFAFLVNNGRANHVWQSAYLDQGNDFATDRFPLPYIQNNPADMAELKLKAGDLVEVCNDSGSTQAMAWPTETARRRETLMLFGYPTGVQGNVVSKATNELVIPNYKQTWSNIRKLRTRPKSRGTSRSRTRSTSRPDAAVPTGLPAARPAPPATRASWPSMWPA